MEKSKLLELLKSASAVLVDSLEKDIKQYNAEEELWNHTVQSELASLIAQKVSVIMDIANLSEG